MSGATGLRFTFNNTRQYDGELGSGVEAPFFERIGTVEELQKCKQLIEQLQERVGDLERINTDLEYRLEDQAKQCMAVEKECTNLERKWRAKCELLETDTETWKREYEAEKQKSARLREHLSRTERELYSILQRKYELMRTGQGGAGGKGGGAFGASGRQNSAENSSGNSLSSLSNVASNRRNSFGNPPERHGSELRRSETPAHSSLEDLFGSEQARAPKEIRQRRMMASLSDFLGT